MIACWCRPISVCCWGSLVSQTYNYPFSSQEVICNYVCVCMFIMCLCFRVCIWVKAKRSVVTWLMPFSRWIRDSDVSAGMNNAHSSTTSLLLFSSPPLVFSHSLLFSSQLPHLKTSSPSFLPLPLLPHAKEGIISLPLSSGQPVSLL